MSAERHQQISNLFWEVCDLVPDEQFAALQARTTDQDLITEVASLLQEHNAQAAEQEGQNVAPLPDKALIDETASLECPGEDAAGSQPLGRATNAARDGSTATVVSSERTHAIPRFALEKPDEDQDVESLDRIRSDMLAHMGSTSKRSLASACLRMVLPWGAVVVALASPGWWLASRWQQKHIAHERLQDVALVTATRNAIGARINQSIESHRTLSVAVSQDAEIRAAIQTLLELPDDERRSSSVDSSRLRQGVHAAIRRSLSLVVDSLRTRLEKRTADPEWKPRYVVWDRTMTIVASWQEGLGDVNSRVHPDGAANLARVLAEQPVLFGPALLNEPVPGFRPETDQPVMGWIVPVYLKSQDGMERDALPSAAMLIRGLGLFDEIDGNLRIDAMENSLDAYLVDSVGTMLTNSPALFRRRSLVSVPEDTPSKPAGPSKTLEPAKDLGVACQYLVAEPMEDAGHQTSRFRNAETVVSDAWLNILRMQSNRLTRSAAACSRGQTGIGSEPYLNYLGDMCVGAWFHLPVMSGGLIVERTQMQPSKLRLSTWLWSLVWTLWASTALWYLRSRLLRDLGPARVQAQPLERYEVLEEIGAGGMGLVYRAKHRDLGREVALKLLRSDRTNPDDRQRFDREARLASMLKNPHSVSIHDYGRDEHGRAFCVMQLLQGLTLYEVVTRGGCQHCGRVIWVLRQICRSIAEAHQRGLMHRDLKPQNVMLQWDELVGDWAVVFDFGLAKPLESSPDMFQTAEKIWAGTPMYMAPERFRQPTLMDPRSDIYSIGGIAYFLLAGRPPFADCDPESMFALILSDEPTEIRTHRGEPIDSRLDHLVTRCLAKSASDRYASVGEITAELEELAATYLWDRQRAADWWQRHAAERMAPEMDGP
ncbi:MAG: serine/threonine-protein kinase [Planctomycetota bacterium]